MIMSSNSFSEDSHWNHRKSTLYPLHPPGSKVVLSIPEQPDLSLSDRLLVAGSSLFIVGSIAWVPYACYEIWKKYRSIPKQDVKRRRKYLAMMGAAIIVMIWGPHRSPRVGQWLQFRKWKLWEAWLRYIAMKVVADDGGRGSKDGDALQHDQQAILAFVPHGIFPFAFAFGALPEASQTAFGVFRPVIATATNMFPFVRTLLKWLSCVDASRSSVDEALGQGQRIGVIPGGIAEMFEGYPKPNTTPDEEYAIIRKGFLRMAVKHGVPVVPVYCFGSTKFFKRLHSDFLERVSLLIRVSLCIFFGKLGFPIPFRQRLLYVMGNPIHPPPVNGDGTNASVDERVNQMHQWFCDELLRLFERHKEAYGWPHKTLKLITR